MKVKGGQCPRRVEGSLETGALLGQFKRSDVFTAELCPGMKGVQAEVMAALVSSVIWKKKTKKKNTTRKKKKVLVQIRHLRTGFMGDGISVRLEWRPRVSSFGFQRKEFFLFSVKTPCVGLVCSSSVISPSSLDWPKVFPQGLYLKYPRWLAALGICAISVIPSSGLIFGLDFAFPSSKTCYSLYVIV